MKSFLKNAAIVITGLTIAFVLGFAIVNAIVASRTPLTEINQK